MQVRRFALTAALLLSAGLAPAALGAAVCEGPARGVCKELEQETQTSLELLQVKKDRAQPQNEKGSQLGLAEAIKATIVSNPLDSIIDKAKDAVGDAVGSVVGSVSDTVSNVVDTTALASIASLINSTLMVIDEKADDLLGQCEEFTQSLLANVSSAGDKGVETVESMVVADMAPLLPRWTVVTKALTAASPPIEEGLSKLGLKIPNSDKMRRLADEVTEQLQNSMQTIQAFSNTTLEEKDVLLAQLNATVEAGLALASSFKDSVVEFQQGLLVSLGKKLGVDLVASSKRQEREEKLGVDLVASSKRQEREEKREERKETKKEERESSQIYKTLDSLMEASQDIADKLESSLTSLFTGPLEATELAVHLQKSHKSGAASLQSFGALLLAAAGLGACGL